MRKLLIALCAVLFLFSLSTCVTTQALKAVKPGHALAEESGYIVLVFTNKVGVVALGSRDVYVVLRQMESGRRFYVPFGSNDEVRLITAAPGIYRIDDFVYLAGINAVKGRDAAKKPEGVLYGAPPIPGTTLAPAAYVDNFKTEFSVNAGEITYIGDYSWDSQFSFTEPGVIIKREFISAVSVYYKVRDAYPDMPQLMQVVSINEESGKQTDDLTPKEVINGQ